MSDQPSAADDAVGAVLSGQWKLLALIGEGGLAAVYEAESLQGHGRRAIKLLHQHYQSQPSVVERFYLEAKSVYSLRHPHIAGVEAYAYAEDGSPYIVMELLQGMNLHDYLRSGQPMSMAQAAPLVYGILQALSVAHARGIVHRDLKPANLFLVPQEGGELTIKVLDFGIAKVMDLAGGMGSKTRTGAVLGTPGYMSPEQVRDSKHVDGRSDLFSVAVVFYEMLTCVHPWGKGDTLARMVAVLQDPPRPIGEVDPRLARYHRFFEQALAKDPAQRFQTAEAMADQVRLLGQEEGRGRVRTEGLQTVAIPQMPMMQMQEPVAAFEAVPPTGVSASHSSAPPPALSPSSPPPAAQVLYGAGSAPVITQVSGQKPAGVPTFVSGGPGPPPVNVVTAAPAESLRLVWWAVVLIALACFAAGFGTGFAVG